MPRERLERTVVWQQIRSNTKKQKLDNGLLRKVEENPDLKKDYENLLKHLPEDQRDRAKVSIAASQSDKFWRLQGFTAFVRAPSREVLSTLVAFSNERGHQDDPLANLVRKPQNFST